MFTSVQDRTPAFISRTATSTTDLGNQAFVESLSEVSTSASIGNELLGLADSDSIKVVTQKINTAIDQYPEHAFEIAMIGATRILLESDSKEEALAAYLSIFRHSDQSFSLALRR